MLLKNARKLTHKGARLQPNWTGPYKISEVVGKGTVRLCDQSDSSKVLSSLYNITRLKFYYERDEVTSEHHSVASEHHSVASDHPVQSRYPDCTAPSSPQLVSSDCDALSNCQSAPPNDNALPSHGSALPCLSTTSDHIEFPPCDIASSDGDGSIKQSALPEKYAPSHSHSSSINTVFCLFANQLLLMVMLHPISPFCRKCVLPPCQLALSPQSATPTPHQMITSTRPTK